jgi:hypothetical protein
MRDRALAVKSVGGIVLRWRWKQTSMVGETDGDQSLMPTPISWLLKFSAGRYQAAPA